MRIPFQFILFCMKYQINMNNIEKMDLKQILLKV